MDSTLVSAMSGVLGSLVGGSASVAATWVAQKTIQKREIIRTQLHSREALYGEFLGECAERLVDAYGRTLEKPETILRVYSLVNRIRLSASPAVLAEAEQLVKHIVEQYFSANLTVEELHKLVLSPDADPLKGFGEACRTELESMYRRT